MTDQPSDWVTIQIAPARGARNISYAGSSIAFHRCPGILLQERRRNNGVTLPPPYETRAVTAEYVDGRIQPVTAPTVTEWF